MRKCAEVVSIVILFAHFACAQAGFPASGEDLTYTINWPSGLSVGEGHLRAIKGSGRWEFEFTVDASVPGFAAADRYQSIATSDFCSLETVKNASHGSRKAREKTMFEPEKGKALRITQGGGKSEFGIAACAKDALTFLYFARRELAQGRIPAAQNVLFGASYQVRLEYTGAQNVAVNDVRMQAERVVASVKGPKADLSFEIFFAPDAARTPLLVRVPLALGSFSMELVR